MDQLRARLAVDDDVAVAIVAENPLMVSVEARQGPNGVFRMAFERDFLGDLTSSELEAVIAHELGHVWIFTHHPYLQTEQLANKIALRIVERETLDAVYDKVRARGGHAGGSLRLVASTAN